MSVSELHRAAALACLELEQVRLATAHARAAVRSARRGGMTAEEALARIVLARALTFGGALTAASVELDRAEALAKPAGSTRRGFDVDSTEPPTVDRGVERTVDASLIGCAHVQRSATLYKAGRVPEAFELANRALRSLPTAAPVERARALNNRGVMRLYLGGYAAGLADLEEAERLLRGERATALAAQVAHNRGMMLARLGDVPAALKAFDAARNELEDLGLPTQRLAVDRAELLLWVRLGAEAVSVLEAALVDLEAGGSGADVAEGLVYLAQALLLVGDPRAAEVAGEARRRYRRARSAGWAAIAGLVEAQAGLAQAEAGEAQAQAGSAPQAGGVGQATPRTADDLLRRARRASRALQRAGLQQYAAEAALLAGRLAHGGGRSAEAIAHLAPLAARRSNGPAHLRARAWEAEARLRLLAGDRRGAARAADAGLAVIDDHRLALGASDLRALASGHGVELAALGLGLALRSGSAPAVLRWAERWRAGALRVPPLRRPDDADLVELLAALRGATAQLAQAELSGGSAAEDERRVIDLEARIRALSRGRSAVRSAARAPAPAAGSGGASGGGTDRRADEPSPSSRFGPKEQRALREALDGRVLVELCEHDGQLVAVVVTEQRCRLRRLGPMAPIAAARDGLVFALRRLARTSSAVGASSAVGGPSAVAAPSAARAGAAASRSLLARTLAELRVRLLEPLDGWLGDRELVVVPTGALHALPWSLLAGDGGRPVSVAPSAGLWLSTRRRAAGPIVDAARTTCPPHLGHVVVAAGPGLPGARDEARRVAAVHPGSTVLDGPAATVESVLAALDGASLGHLAAHGVLRRDNPLFSSIRFEDGPATIYDLERLAQPPRGIVLSACNSAVHEVVAGEELLGLAAALLGLGTGVVVASVLPLPDGETVPVMARLHERLAAGRGPAEAVAEVQAETRPHVRTAGLGDDAASAAGEKAWLAAASLVCLGAG